MSIRQFAFPLAMAAAAAVAIPGASRAQTTKTQEPCIATEDSPEAMAGRPPCFLDELRVVSVRPYSGLTTLQGARIDLEPQLGFTVDDLDARLQQVLKAGKREPLPACLVGVGSVNIDANAQGEASTVTLIAKDPKDADRILSRARQLVK